VQLHVVRRGSHQGRIVTAETQREVAPFTEQRADQVGLVVVVDVTGLRIPAQGAPVRLSGAQVVDAGAVEPVTQ